MARFDSGDVGAMQDASSSEILGQLNEVAGRVPAVRVVLVLGALVGVGAAALSLPVEAWFVLAVLVGLCFIAAMRRDASALVLELNYELDHEVAERFEDLARAVDQLSQASLVRCIEAEGAADEKRNAGASTLVTTTSVKPTSGLPPRVRSNIQVPFLPAGRQTLFFLPDRLLVWDGGRYGAVAYEQLRAHAGVTRFVEPSARPHDAEQVGTAWRYTNKSGGPDRRFRDNAEYPVYLYGELDLESSSGLRERFHISRSHFAEDLAVAVRAIARAHVVLSHR